MFLLRPEIIELSGLHRQSAVCRWLDRQGIQYLVGADGWPRVLRSAIMERLGGQIVPHTAQPELILD